MIEICRDHAANVKRWQDGQMVLRWIAAAMDEARRQFRRESSRPHRTLDHEGEARYVHFGRAAQLRIITVLSCSFSVPGVPPSVAIPRQRGGVRRGGRDELATGERRGAATSRVVRRAVARRGW